MYGDYYTPRSSWLRLVIHKCDPAKREKEGKECATSEAIEDYFYTMLASLEIQRVKPNLMQYEKEPLIKYYVDGDYTSKGNRYLARGTEYLVSQSLVELEDNLIGFMDEPKNLHFLEWVRGNTWIKDAEGDAANTEHTGMIMYWNFLLQREQSAYYRIRYNLMSILEKVGGLMSCISVLVIFLLKPCYYKKHALAMLQEYEQKGLCRDENHDTSCVNLPLDISPVRLFLHDLKQFLL